MYKSKRKPHQNLQAKSGKEYTMSMFRKDTPVLMDIINLSNWNKYPTHKRKLCATRVAISYHFQLSEKGQTGDPHLARRVYSNLMAGVTCPQEYGWTTEQVIGLIGPVPLTVRSSNSGQSSLEKVEPRQLETIIH